jgi:aryl-alcohol dehydrogenase-like predicted oxidoreductase
VQYRQLGYSGLRVSEIALGSWLTLGSSVQASESRALVQRAFELGVNLFDTADVYSEGACEEALGKALRDLPRDAVVIATKAYFPTGPDPNARGLSRKHLIASVEASLRRLGTDYLDLHQCHRFDPETPLEETIATYADLVRSGKLRYWGVSLWSPRQLLRARWIARRLRAPAPISNQPEYSLLAREPERRLFRASRWLGVSQIAWSPLAQGVLTGKYRAGALPEGTRAADALRSNFMARYLAPETLARASALAELAAERGLSAAQLALAWCLREPNVASVVVGATRISQIEDNAAASGLALDAELLARLDRLFPRA